MFALDPQVTMSCAARNDDRFRLYRFTMDREQKRLLPQIHPLHLAELASRPESLRLFASIEAALAAADVGIARIEESARADVLRACRGVIERFKNA